MSEFQTPYTGRRKMWNPSLSGVMEYFDIKTGRDNFESDYVVAPVLPNL
jgi:hypothetical protein